MKRDPLRPALAALAIVLLAAYALVFRPCEDAIAQRYSEIAAARETLERDRAVTQRLPQLTQEHAAILSLLNRWHVRDSRAANVDRFLHAAAQVAARNAIGIQSVAAVAGPAALSGDIDLTVTLRGPYPAVLHAMRDLASTGVAAQIMVAGFGNSARAGTHPTLDATFHVTLLRDTDVVPNRPPHSV